jgi:hypothetical protein
MADWPLRINITEEDLWKPYDSSYSGKGSNVADWASDNAYDDLQHMDAGTWADYVLDLVEAFLPKAKQKKIGPDEIDKISTLLRGDWGKFENIEYAVRDAHTLAWEIAYTPEDKDIEYAIKRALERWDEEITLADYWDLILSDEASKGPKEWSPLKKITERELFNQLEAAIWYEHEKGKWDRFVVFDFMSAPAVKAMKRALMAHPEEGRLFQLDDELEYLAKNFIGYLSGALGQVMQDNDPSMNWDVGPHWKSILSDKSRRQGIQEDIAKALATPSPEE